MNKHTTDDARFLELLERWLSGAFDRTDEGELHALTAADAFRREAWEGFLVLPETEHAARLADIRRRLFPNRPARRVPLGAWVSAAAALALVAAAIYFWPKADPNDSLAQTAQHAENTQAATTDDIVAATDLADAPSPASGRTVPEMPAAPERRNERSVRAYEQPEQDDLAAMDMAKEEEKNALVSPTTPHEAGVVQVEETRRSATAQPSGVASVPDLDVLSEKARAAEPAKMEAPASSVSMKKKSDSAGTPANPKPVAKPPAAEPNGGWDTFREYLLRNARLPEAARNNNISGTVRLQFTIGPDGKPLQMRVLQKLGYGCDEEAERLVRLFDWTPPGTDSVVVDVPFLR